MNKNYLKSEETCCILCLMYSIEEIILQHIGASGPVSKRSIEAYAVEQFNGGHSSIGGVLQRLRRQGKIAIYDPSQRPMTWILAIGEQNDRTLIPGSGGQNPHG